LIPALLEQPAELKPCQLSTHNSSRVIVIEIKSLAPRRQRRIRLLKVQN